MNQSARKQGRFLKNVENGVLVIWTPAQAMKSGMIECDRNGTPFDSPENDQKYIRALERQMQERDAKIEELEERIKIIQASLPKVLERDEPEEVPEVRLKEAGIHLPEEPDPDDLYGAKAQRRLEVAAADSLRPQQWAPEPEPQPEEEAFEEAEIDSVFPEEDSEPGELSFDEKLIELQAAGDNQKVKEALIRFANDRYGMDLDRRYMVKKLVEQIQMLESKRVESEAE